MSFISEIFGGGRSAPAPQAAPAPPGLDAGTLAAQEAAAAAERERRMSSGRASTNPTGGLGDTSQPNLAAKSLLGQ